MKDTWYIVATLCHVKQFWTRNVAWCCIVVSILHRVSFQTPSAPINSPMTARLHFLHVWAINGTFGDRPLSLLATVPSKSFPSAPLIPMESKQKLLAQVHNLKSDCLSSHQAFISILHQLQNIVADLALPSDSRQLVSKHASQWEDYCSTYIRIIWRSRYIAENAEASARELVSLLSPCNQGNVLCIEDVHKCLATVKRDKARGQELVDDLSALKLNIDLFSNDWEIVASALSLKRQSDQDIPERTNKVTTALNAIRSKMYRMYNTIQRASAKAACFGSKAIYTMLDDIEEKSEKHEPKLPSSIGPPQDAFDNIAVPISLICTIWLAISADLGQVAGFIGLTGEAGEHNQIQRRIELLHAEYTFLANIFSQYQLAVANRPPIIRKRKLPSVDSKIPSNTKI